MRTKTILYSCPFIPPEWITAHGWRPRRIVPASQTAGTQSGSSAGVCLYLQSWMAAIQAEPAKDAVILTTLCDQMRRGAEWIEANVECPVFLFNVPSTWHGDTPRRLYRDELSRLGRFLQRGGGTVSESETLIKNMYIYDTARRNLLARRPVLSAAAFFARLANFHSGDLGTIEQNHDSQPREGVPIGLLGGPLLRDSIMLLDRIEEAGGRIVLNALENGERTLPSPFDEIQMDKNPVEELTRAYFDSVPDPSRRPNDRFYQWLEEITAARALRGWLVFHYPWCDIWRAEIRRIKDTLSIPVVDINLGETPGPGGMARAMTRIQSLLDLIR